MSNKKYTLKDLLTIKNGKDYKELGEGDIPVYGTGGIIRRVDDFLYVGESILLPRKGTLSNICYVNEKFWTVDTMYWTIVNEDLAYPKFLYCYLSLLDLSHRDSGSTLPSMTFDSYYSIPINLPPMKVQKIIGDFIFKLNKKIENNNKINAELELMAKTIYDYWFLQFEFPNEEGKPYKSSGGKMVWNEELKREIPDGWNVGKLSDIAQIVMGSSPKGESLNEKEDGIIFYQGKTDFGKRFPRVRMYTNKPIKYAEANSVLLSVRAPVGDINITNKKCCIGRGLASICSKYQSFIFYLMLSNQYRFDKYNNGGTTFGALTKDELFEMKIIIPEEKVMYSFNELIKNNDELIKKNFEQNCELEEMRDFLLPLLMNGQVGFKDNINEKISHKNIEEKEKVIK